MDRRYSFRLSAEIGLERVGPCRQRLTRAVWKARMMNNFATAHARSIREDALAKKERDLAAREAAQDEEVRRLAAKAQELDRARAALEDEFHRKLQLLNAERIRMAKRQENFQIAEQGFNDAQAAYENEATKIRVFLSEFKKFCNDNNDLHSKRLLTKVFGEIAAKGEEVLDVSEKQLEVSSSVQMLKQIKLKK